MGCRIPAVLGPRVQSRRAKMGHGWYIHTYINTFIHTKFHLNHWANRIYAHTYSNSYHIRTNTYACIHTYIHTYIQYIPRMYFLTNVCMYECMNKQLGFESEEKDRPQFHGDPARSKINNRTETYFPEEKRRVIAFFSYVSIFLLIGTALAVQVQHHEKEFPFIFSWCLLVDCILLVPIMMMLGCRCLLGILHDRKGSRILR